MQIFCSTEALLVPPRSVLPSFFHKPPLTQLLALSPKLLTTQHDFTWRWGGINSIPHSGVGVLALCLSHLSVPSNKTKAQPRSTLSMIYLACFWFLTSTPPYYFSYYLCLIFLFFSNRFFVFFPLNTLSACSCLDVGQKFRHCVVWMPYFHSAACLELRFVRSLACRGHFLLTVLEVTVPKHWLAREERGEKNTLLGEV